MRRKGVFTIFFRSLSSKIVALITLLLVGAIGTQTLIFVQLESKNLENTLLQNKKDFTELLAKNLGTTQELGGFAFQSQLIKKAAETQDTLSARWR
ncbi:MAG: hypothetical protein QXD72_03170 [Candidatus Aenigmatarchaeota archaeon]